MGIAEGIKYYAKEGKEVVDKVACSFSGFFEVGGYGIGPAYGMYDDLSNNDKTVGEAVAHNSTSLGVALGTGVVLGAIGTPVLTGLAIGAIIGLTFGVFYNKDWFKLQTGLDKAGEAISSDLSKLNLMNWGKG